MCIGNHYWTENREFQSIAFAIDSNCVHSNDPYPFYIQFNKSTQTLYSYVSHGSSAWCLCLILIQFKITLKYISILFSILNNPHRVNSLFSINTHFFNDSICLLKGNHFHLIDQTTMNLFVVFALFMFHAFYCLIIMWTIQQMTLL